MQPSVVSTVSSVQKRGKEDSNLRHTTIRSFVLFFVGQCVEFRSVGVGKGQHLAAVKWLDKQFHINIEQRTSMQMSRVPSREGNE